MTVDERLRESLQRRAQSVEPSPDGWAAVTRRIDRRQRRTRTVSLSLAAGMSFAAVALVVMMTTVIGRDPSNQNVAAGGGTDSAARSTTTLSSAADPDGPTDGVSPPVTAQNAAPGVGTDPGQPRVIGAPGGPMAATGRNYTPEAVWPDTLAELERLQALADDQQPWRKDPAAVAAAYLADRGIGTQNQSPPVGDADVVVRYSTGLDGGRVHLSRLLDGSIYYVTGARGDDISEVHVVRQGDRLGVDVTVSLPGRVVVRTKQPGSDWNESVTRTVVADQPVSLTADGAASSALIVQVRLEADIGIQALSEQYLGASVLGFDYENLHRGSALRFGGIGPIQIGATLTEAERAAGIPLITNIGEHCTTLGPMGRVGGLLMLSTGGSDKVDVITVSDVPVRTEAGIGVGSTVAEARSAYPGLVERLTDGNGRLVVRPTDPALADYEMVFQVVDGEVASMWSGKKGLSLSDELCA